MIEPIIIGSGSSGNATLLDSILIDCGMPSRAIVPYMKKLQLVLLTHIHCDHFKPSTLRRIYSERPSVRYVCGEHLAGPLIDAGIPPSMIDVVSPGQIYDYGKFEIEPVELVHNVRNFGYKIRFCTGESAIYATDTNSLDGIEAKDYTFYFIEANHGEKEIHDRIKRKALDGEYAYEYDAARNHLSREKADAWIYRMAGVNSLIYYMHEHRDHIKATS
jgi:phosphoribosyl 1,2-cyclic phosphodiesterase